MEELIGKIEIEGVGKLVSSIRNCEIFIGRCTQRKGWGRGMREWPRSFEALSGLLFRLYTKERMFQTNSLFSSDKTRITFNVACLWRRKGGERSTGARGEAVCGKVLIFAGIKRAAGGVCARLLAGIDSQDDPFVSRYKSIYPQIAPVARLSIVTDIIWWKGNIRKYSFSRKKKS